MHNNASWERHPAVVPDHCWGSVKAAPAEDRRLNALAFRVKPEGETSGTSPGTARCALRTQREGSPPLDRREVIAASATVRNAWGNRAPPVDAAVVAKMCRALEERAD
jgi:hypothetical protein